MVLSEGFSDLGKYAQNSNCVIIMTSASHPSLACVSMVNASEMQTLPRS